MAEFLTTFNFEVILSPSGAGGDDGVSATASFSDVSGLDLTIEVEALREGGYNGGVRQLFKRASSSPLVLKRGMTSDPAFWAWVQRCLEPRYPLPYVQGEIRVYPPDVDRGAATPARWTFVNGLATKVSAPALAAAGGGSVPLEELTISHEGLTRCLS